MAGDEDSAREPDAPPAGPERGLDDVRQELEELRRRLGDRERELAERSRAVMEAELRVQRAGWRAAHLAEQLARRAEELDARQAELEERAQRVGRGERLGGEEQYGRFDLATLERLVEDEGNRYPERIDEWVYYLLYLRDYAASDGRLPLSLDWLVEEVFADLVRSEHGGGE